MNVCVLTRVYIDAVWPYPLLFSISVGSCVHVFVAGLREFKCVAGCKL